MFFSFSDIRVHLCIVIFFPQAQNPRAWGLCSTSCWRRMLLLVSSSSSLEDEIVLCPLDLLSSQFGGRFGQRLKGDPQINPVFKLLWTLQCSLFLCHFFVFVFYFWTCLFVYFWTAVLPSFLCVSWEKSCFIAVVHPIAWCNSSEEVENNCFPASYKHIIETPLLFF